MIEQYLWDGTWVVYETSQRPKYEEKEQNNMSKASKRPEIVCLCGSTRFYEAFGDASYALTLQGKIVLSIGDYRGARRDHTAEQKTRLDALHLHKIEMADRVHVLNVNGYVGDSTRKEIAFAIANGKRITWHDAPAGAQYLVDTWDTLADTMAAL